MWVLLREPLDLGRAAPQPSWSCSATAAQPPRMPREHREPFKLLVPCNRLQWSGTPYGDLYWERISGFNYGYGGGDPYTVSKLIKDYRGLEAVADDPDLHVADRGFIENREYQNAAILLELCSGKAHITVYKLG